MAEDAGRALLTWFDRYKRDLPWRRTRDPYAIWVSEIMLQQTRVAAVLEHYARWMERFPDVETLAAAQEAEVLALWSGLGYYRRARMLHRAAQMVVAEHGGVLPGTAAELRLLPGIGEYTSAAIASIAFGEAVAVVDGNVERVVSRLHALSPVQGLPLQEEGRLAADRGKRRSFDSAGRKRPASLRMTLQKEGGASRTGENESLAGENASRTAEKTSAAALTRAIRAGAAELLSAQRPGDSNQAMMELGATVCLPKAPLCLHCPVQPWCGTRGEHAVRPRKPQQTRAIAYGLATRAAGAEVLLRQRAGDASLMAGMWELPELDTAPDGAPPLLRLKHAITVTDYTVGIVKLNEAEAGRLIGAQWQSTAELPRLALTGLARKVLRRLGVWPAV